MEVVWSLEPLTWDLRCAAGIVSGTKGSDVEAEREPHTMIKAASTEVRNRIENVS